MRSCSICLSVPISLNMMTSSFICCCIRQTGPRDFHKWTTLTTCITAISLLVHKLMYIQCSVSQLLWLLLQWTWRIQTSLGQKAFISFEYVSCARTTWSHDSSIVNFLNGTSKLVSRMTVLIYLATNGVQASLSVLYPFPITHILIMTVIFSLVDSSHPHWPGNFTVFNFCFSGAFHQRWLSIAFHMHIGGLCLLVKTLLGYLAHFCSGCLTSHLWVVESFISSECHPMTGDVFLHICRLSVPCTLLLCCSAALEIGAIAFNCIGPLWFWGLFTTVIWGIFSLLSYNSFVSSHIETILVYFDLVLVTSER